MITIKMTGRLEKTGWIRTVVKGEGEELTKYAEVLVNGIVNPMKEIWEDCKEMIKEDQKDE